MCSNQFTKKTAFISVEVSIYTNHDCDEWITWFEEQDNYVDKHAHTQYRWYVYFAPMACKNANLTIKMLCGVIQNLPDHVRSHWDNAERKDFHIGYAVGEEPHWYGEHLEVETLRMATALGADIRIAMYPAQPTDEDGCPEDDYE